MVYLLFAATWLVRRPVGMRMRDILTRNRTTNRKTVVDLGVGDGLFSIGHPLSSLSLLVLRRRSPASSAAIVGGGKAYSPVVVVAGGPHRCSVCWGRFTYLAVWGHQQESGKLTYRDHSSDVPRPQIVCR